MDIHDAKIKQIKQNADRLSVKIIEPLKLDAKKIGEKFPNQADKILVDAPCSGLGVLRRKADIRWKKIFSEINDLPVLQEEILNGAAGALKIGGTLLYSTCTILKRENLDVAEKFLTTHKNFELIETKNFLPHVTNTDGFFYAKFIRKS